MKIAKMILLTISVLIRSLLYSNFNKRFNITLYPNLVQYLHSLFNFVSFILLGVNNRAILDFGRPTALNVQVEGDRLQNGLLVLVLDIMREGLP